jgi:hypothetical protein
MKAAVVGDKGLAIREVPHPHPKSDSMFMP